MDFKQFRAIIAGQWAVMQAHTLVRVAVDPQVLADSYVDAFPAEANPVVRVRRAHDCSSCRSFVKKLGGVVAIANGEVMTIWDSVPDDGSPYSIVAAKMADLVRDQAIAHKFFYAEGPTVGVDHNYEEDPEKPGSILFTWDHFVVPVTKGLTTKALIGKALGDADATAQVFGRGLRELSLDSIDTVLDLIAQNALYRGEEHKFALDKFRFQKVEFARLLTERQKELYVWETMEKLPESVSRLRNTAIGTAVISVQEGKPLEEVVHAFGSMMVGYKRPTTSLNLITPKMLMAAQEEIEQQGLTSALYRRHAVLSDITVPNTLFVDRTTKKAMGIFEELASKVPASPKKLDHVDEVGIDKFLSDILPTATSLEVMVENKHSSNFVSLMAPTDSEAKSLFKWGNPFSWTYAGDAADSTIKERVKAAGGNVDGYWRNSLSWFNTDDLDFYLDDPRGNHIYYASRTSSTGGNLDVDANNGNLTTTPVENIYFQDKTKLVPGTYRLGVSQFRKRNNVDGGFEVEIAIEGESPILLSYKAHLPQGAKIQVAEFTVDAARNITVKPLIESSSVSKEVWGVTTQTWRKVNILMFSPNYWDGQGVGNKHLFFMLEGCRNEATARGFYNEFLLESLTPHRKAMEIVGSKLRIEPDPNQLSGLGFSSTKKGSLLVKVGGSFNRVIKVIFGG